jgi:hypothetical protein
VPITGAILKENPVTLYNTMHQNFLFVVVSSLLSFVMLWVQIK